MSCSGKRGKIIDVCRRTLSSSYSVGRKLTRVVRQIRNGVLTTSLSEKRLLKKNDIAKAYSDCIEQYASKGCIRKVP